MLQVDEESAGRSSRLLPKARDSETEEQQALHDDQQRAEA